MPSKISLAVDLGDLPEGSSVDVIETKIREDAEERVRATDELPQTPLTEKEKQPLQPKKVSFVLQRIVIEDDSDSISADEVTPILNAYENREINQDDLQELIQKLEGYYRSKGFFVAVTLPPQRLENAELRLRVIVSKMGDLEVHGNRFFRKKMIKSYWKIHKGEVIEYKKIRNSLLDMNSNPDRTVRAGLQAGREKQTTDIILNVKDKFPIQARYSFDNQGVKLTGKRRNGFSLRSNNMLGLDDIFQIGTVYGKEFGAIYLNHVIPLPLTRTQFIWGFSHAQVAPKKEFERFDINGRSETYSLKLRQTHYQSEKISFNSHIGIDFKDKRTRVLGVTTARDRLRVLTSGIELLFRDLSGIWKVEQGLDTGLPLHGDGYALNSRQSEMQFFKYRFKISRQQRLPLGLKASAKLVGQLTSSRLAPQEQIFFGGADSIRGYPESDYGADQGLRGSLEFTAPSFFIPKSYVLPFALRPLRDQISLVSFLDYGYGRINDPLAGENATRNFLGIGGGLQVRFRENLYASIELGFPVGDDPLTEGGNKQLHFRLSSQV